MTSISKIILLISVLFFIGCAAITGTQKTTANEAPKSSYILVNQATEDMPEMIVEPLDPEKQDSPDGPKLPIAHSGNTNVSRKIIQGFRIQLLTTRNKAEADSLAILWSNELDMKIYKPFESPYFKLRVGNFESEGHADELLEELRRAGFDGAWLVPDRVYLDSD